MYTLPYIKYITNKYFLYNTGNSTQYSATTGMINKSEKKMEIFIYIYLNHFAVHLKLTPYCKLTISSVQSSCSVVSDSLRPHE